METSENKLNQQAIGFLKESIEKLEKAMIEGFSTMHARLEIMAKDYVRREEMDRDLLTRDNQIKSLEDNQKWVVRSIIGIVIIALMGVIIVTRI